MVIVIHYGGRQNATTVVAKRYGRVSETPCFPGGIPTGNLHKKRNATAIVNYYAIVFLVWQGPLGEFFRLQVFSETFCRPPQKNLLRLFAIWGPKAQSLVAQSKFYPV